MFKELQEKTYLHYPILCLVDIDECSLYHPCLHNCTNTPGSFYCSCYSGYDQVGYNCYGKCRIAKCNCMNALISCIPDKNECSSNGGLGPCQQICTNKNGSFICSCRIGYSAPSGLNYCNGVEVTCTCTLSM